MLDARKICSVLTGFAFLFQTLFLPLSRSAQTSKKSEALVCVAQDLVKNESWTYPYPGSQIDVFKKLLGNYVVAHGNPRLQYRIKAEAHANQPPLHTDSSFSYSSGSYSSGTGSQPTAKSETRAAS